MSSIVLWLNTQEAKVFVISPDGTRRQVRSASGRKHPVETHGKIHTVDESDEKKFYHELALSLKGEDSTEWYVLGPGVGRLHFAGHLKAHHPDLQDRILASEVMDDESDFEILKKGREFFHRRRLYQGLL